MTRISIHRAGWPFIFAAAAANAVGFALVGWLGAGLLPVTLWVVAFFRDPERPAPAGGNMILSPADGRLLPLVRVVPPPELGLGPLPRMRMSIFMSIFNVHVNRIPCDGTVTGLAYRPGKFFNAAFDKASVYNERMSIRMRTESGRGAGADLGVVQIAGLIARRIQCGLQEGQKVCRGDRFGIIRFGSRLEVFLPEGVRVVAQEGQSVRAGVTVLAEFPS
ncbi:MAG: phosphatidylserine decarboxylase [Rhizomicrobium sp.]